MKVPGLPLLFSALLLLPGFSCTKAGSAPGTGNSGGGAAADTTALRLDAGSDTVLTDLPYGRDGKQKMDLGLVAGRKANTPFVVLLHGGAWSGGDKKDLQSAVDFFNAQGINVANVNYRLTSNSAGSVRWTGILSDVGEAIGYLRAQASYLQTRPAGIVVFGFSAGAHLALLHAYSYDSANLVSAVIGFGTPTKFNDVAWKVNPYLGVARQALPLLTGQTFSTDTSNLVLKELSPWFSPQFKPTLLIAGDQDKVVPYSQSLLMNARLKETGTASAFISLAHGGHMGEGVSPGVYADAMAACAAWINKYSH